MQATENQDVLLRSLSSNAEIAVLVVDGKNLVQEAVQRHSLAPTAAVAFGRALLGSMLLGVFRKDQESMQVTFKSEGPLGGIFVIADSQGNVRGRWVLYRVVRYIISGHHHAHHRCTLAGLAIQSVTYP